MELKSNKKPAMVLILILMIITSLSIFIIGAMKVLTSSNEEYSVNRNASGADSSRNLGKFICYKINNTLYQQRVEYNTDGSVRIAPEEKNVDSCIFEVPNGIRNFEIIAVGGGGAGGASKRKYNPGEPVDVHKNEIPNLLNNHFDSIAKGLNLALSCQNRYRSRTSSPLNCKGLYCSKTGCGSKYRKYTSSLNQFPESNSLIGFEGLVNAVRNSNICGYSETKNYLSSRYVLSASCYLYYEGYDDTEQTIKTRREPISKEQIIAQNADSIKNYLIDKIRNLKIRKRTPYYDLNIGTSGSAGQVNTAVINNMIYGSANPNNQQENIIEIKKEQIGNGGTLDNEKGEDTVFKYYYKNTSGYKELEIRALGGNGGGYTTSKATTPEQAIDIKSKQGALPENFILPSVFNFVLSPGYYEDSKSGMIPHRATYFGSSGASGYIDGMQNDMIGKDCESVCVNECSSSEQITQTKCTRRDEDNLEVTRQGTGGADGAIIISW